MDTKFKVGETYQTRGGLSPLKVIAIGSKYLACEYPDGTIVERQFDGTQYGPGGLSYGSLILNETRGV